MSNQEVIARIIFGVVYGVGSDRGFDFVQPIYKQRAMEAAAKVLEALGDSSGRRPDDGQLPLLAESEFRGDQHDG